MFMRLFQAGKSSDFGVIRGAGPGVEKLTAESKKMTLSDYSSATISRAVCPRGLMSYRSINQSINQSITIGLLRSGYEMCLEIALATCKCENS